MRLAGPWASPAVRGRRGRCGVGGPETLRRGEAVGRRAALSNVSRCRLAGVEER